MREPRHFFCGLVIVLAATLPALSQDKPNSRPHLADYDSELRLPSGRVDVDTMLKRLKELGVTAYYWLVWHAATDWDDLKAFLPQAAEADIDVWVYLAPPSEAPPNYGDKYPEPFRLDYVRWGEEIARLSVQHPNLKAWVIDDFYANRAFFTPTYVRKMQVKAKAINPPLDFLPLMYFPEIKPKFVEDYRGVIDGVVAAYLQDREQIERTWALLNDADVPAATELRYPWDRPSRPGDHLTVGQSAKAVPAERYEISFRERDDFTGPTAGYHFKQLLVDGTVVWEQDVAGGTTEWHNVTVDATRHIRGKSDIALAFRLLDKKGVSNFGVQWRLAKLHAENLKVAADLSEPQKWKVERKGAFETGFGVNPKFARRRFHIPFISMTAAHAGQFRKRHGDPATPERISQQLRLSLEAWRQGKCDGVVTYCLDKSPKSATYPRVQKLFHEYRVAESQQH